MSKNCARCEKIVYPTEELKCLDKVWHKLCFKCKDCGMALNMRTYKGFNKEPYCEAHIPKAKATTMAETPELRRIAENTKLQSNVNYHADFEKSKGKFTQVADDPETLRIKQNTKIISNVAYHGDLQRKEDMEKRRQLNENGNTVDVPVLRKEVPNNAPPPASNNYSSSPVPTQQPVSRVNELQNSGNPQQFISPYSARTSQTLIYSSESGGVIDSTPYRHIGSVNDMDPLNHNYGSLGSAGAGGGGGAASALGRVYRALYDYEAQDEDEVSFQDGDLIVNVTSIDRGWMTGQVQRTGQTGMLPANYVEVVNI